MSALLAAAADPNALDRRQRTPLHEAAKHGHVEAAAILVQHGGRADALDADLSTPLTLAMRGRRGRGDPRLVQVLSAPQNARHARRGALAPGEFEAAPEAAELFRRSGGERMRVAVA